MNEWITIGVLASVNLGTAAFVYGKLTERVKNNTAAITAEKYEREADVKELRGVDADQWVRIGHNEMQIERVKVKVAMNGN